MSAGARFVEFYRLYSHPSLIAVFFLGVASGLPLMLTLSTLTAWLAEAGVDLTTIGLFAAVTTPYAFKFLWAPIVDRVPLPGITSRFGRRRGWLFVSQALLILSLLGMAVSDPAKAPLMMAIWAISVAFFSATQDIVIDAYRVELLEEKQQGAGAAAVVLGYRIGMLISGAGGLYMATAWGWELTYVLMAAIVSVGSVTALLIGEPKAVYHALSMAVGASRVARVKAWLKDTIVAPFADFMQRKGWVVILLFVVFYKFGDAFAMALSTAFLLDIGFTKNEIAGVAKTFGLFATIAGAMIGGILVSRIGIIKSLWICGFLQMASILLFLLQAKVGHVVPVLMLTVAGENLAAGMGTAAFVAFLSRLCSVEYTATQYALLSSLAATGRTWLSTPSGKAAEILGWEGFFLLATLFAVPGLILLWIVQRYQPLAPRVPAETNQ